MATGINPYQRRWEDHKNNHLAIHNLAQSLELKDVDPIYITSDGKIIANGFIDANDNAEISLDRDKKLSYKNQINPTTQEVESLNTTTTYVMSGVMSEVVIEGFKNYANPTKIYDEKDTVKFLNLNKNTRKLVSSASNSAPFLYGFTHENSSRYALPRMEGSWISPFNYDVYIAPDSTIKGTRDIVVIKSGEFERNPQVPPTSLIALADYSTGVSGNLYINTLSYPDTPVARIGVDKSAKLFKIPRSGNSNRVSDTTEIVPIGPIGIFKNGVIAYSYRVDNSYSGLGAYNNNAIKSDSYGGDSCNGYLSELEIGESGNMPDKTYHYKAAPICLYDTGNSTGHSPLLGYAFDGYPIYGPYGHGTALDPTSASRLITPSYRLKPITNRPNGPEYSGSYVSGYFIEDYEFINGLGDLDEYNGRTCVTPEYPNGTYAYFTTVSTGSNGTHTPKFPYIIGNKFYGKVEKENWTGVTRSEPSVFVTGAIGGGNVDIDLIAENIFGLKYTKRGGIKKETIIFVTPHEAQSQTGIFLTTGTHQRVTSSGTSGTFSGNLFNAAGNTSSSGQSNRFLPEEVGYSYPTSVSNQFLPVAFSGNMPYLRIDSDTNVIQELTGHSNTTGTSFYSMYSGYKSGFNDKIYTGVWDGRIPSGTPFKIETWSFNGFANGFENRLKIYPCENHASISGKVLSVSGQFVGEGNSEEEAFQAMSEKGKKQLFKEIDSFLIDEGIKEPSRKLGKYGRLLTQAN